MRIWKQNPSGAPIGASGIKMPPLGLDYFLVCAEQGFDVMLIE